MNKLKTRKALLKRIKITKKGKIIHRSTHQGHFNAKESGNKTRKKRRSNQLASVNKRRIKKILPHL